MLDVYKKIKRSIIQQKKCDIKKFEVASKSQILGRTGCTIFTKCYVTLQSRPRYHHQ